ncbi:MAG: twin-arginine translocation signal domain-containing protein, partial [Gammaproteobacteria bacterium]|nr:twin-arginine translocation signal domain-containing protein [Gammaproteobacteria bacterium]
MHEMTSRREFLALTAAAAATAACSKVETNGAKTMTTELTDLSATEAVALMRRGDLAALDYATALVEQCGRWEHLNAWISFEPERVLESAREADRLRASGA